MEILARTPSIALQSTTWFKKTEDNYYKTSSEAVSKRPCDTLCRWIFC